MGSNIFPPFEGIPLELFRFCCRAENVGISLTCLLQIMLGFVPPVMSTHLPIQRGIASWPGSLLLCAQGIDLILEPKFFFCQVRINVLSFLFPGSDMIPLSNLFLFLFFLHSLTRLQLHATQAPTSTGKVPSANPTTVALHDGWFSSSTKQLPRACSDYLNPLSCGLPFPGLV